LGRIAHQDRPHAPLGGAVDIDLPVVNEAALLRRFLDQVQRQAINPFIRLANSYIARAYE
jgi:hypothetical protein